MAIAFTGDKEAAAADTNFPVAPKGTYYLKVRNAQEKVSQKSGRNMIATEYVIVEGDYADKVHVFNYLTFIAAGDKGHGMTVHALKAHGLPCEGDIEISAADFFDITVKVDLDQEEYPVGSGQMKNVIKKFHLPPSDEEAGTAQEPVETAPEPEPEPEPAVSPKENRLVAAAKAAGLTKSDAKVRVAAPAVKKPLPWAKKK